MENLATEELKLVTCTKCNNSKPEHDILYKKEQICWMCVEKDYMEKGPKEKKQ